MEHLSLGHFLQAAKYHVPGENTEDESKQVGFSAKHFLPLHQLYWDMIYIQYNIHTPIVSVQFGEFSRTYMPEQPPQQ